MKKSQREEILSGSFFMKEGLSDRLRARGEKSPEVYPNSVSATSLM